MTIIHCITTFVGSYYNKDFHVPANVIVITFVGNRYICSRQRLLRLWKMYYISGFITINAADFYYFCGFITFAGIITLAGVREVSRVSKIF